MNELIINKKDLAYNINKIKSAEMRKDYTYIAVIKGNAYGLDMFQFASLLIENGIDYFAVAGVDEALQLRNAGFREKILLLTQIIDKTILEQLIDNRIILTLDSEDSISIASQIAQEKNITIDAHLKVDTGLARYGFNWENEEITNIIKKYSNINYEGIYSHFSNSLASDNTWSETQFVRFNIVINKLEENGLKFQLKHICNSSGYFKYQKMHLNCARIGSAFCGLASGPDADLRRIGLFHTKITKIREINKGDYIGYANSYKAKKKMKIAIIPTGYFEGIGRDIETQRYKLLSRLKKSMTDLKKNNKTLRVNREELNVVGQIGMHDIVLDVTGKDYKENDDIFIDVRPILIDSSVLRIYK